MLTNSWRVNWLSDKLIELILFLGGGVQLGLIRVRLGLG